MESPTKKKKSDHNTDELLNPFSPFPSPFPFNNSSSTPLTAMINEGVMTPFLTGMTPSIHDKHQAPSSRDWTPSMRENIAEGFELQHAMSPPVSRIKNRSKRDSAGNNALSSPLFPDLTDTDGLFDTEAQNHLNKNKEALANRIKATEGTNHSKPHFPQSSRKINGNNHTNHNSSLMEGVTLGDMQALSKSSLLGDVMHPSSSSATSATYKFGIAETSSLFSGIQSLPSSQHSGLAAITAAADVLQQTTPLEINTNLPSPIVKTAISHPKKQRLKTKDDTTDFSAPSSPLRPPNSLSSMYGGHPSISKPVITAPFSRNNSTSSQPPPPGSGGSMGNTPYNRSKSLNALEEKAKIEEIIQMGIARAAQQRADDSKTITCNCKKSKCLKMYCDCFRLTEYCKKSCNCFDCNNTEMYEEARQMAIRNITERNPEAFKPRVIVEEETVQGKSHLTGCHCRKSACLKKYCECFTGNVPCTSRCRCIDCKNVPELYHFDESVRKQAFALTQASAAAASSSSKNAAHGAANVNRTPSRASAHQPAQALFNSPRGKDHPIPSTKLAFSDIPGNHHNNHNTSNSHLIGGGGLKIIESDHSNLTTSTLYSTDNSTLASHHTGKGEKGERLSISVGSPLKQTKYKAMTSPELRGLNATSQFNELRNTMDSVGSESTNNTERTDRSVRLGTTGEGESAPSSPIRSSNMALNHKDALLSPIKLLELADVCSERQSQEEQEFIISSHIADLRDEDEQDHSNNNNNNKNL